MNKFLCLFFSLSFISNSIWFSFILLLFFTRSLKWQQKSISNRNIQSISSAMVLRTCFRSHITHTHHNKYLMNRRAPIDYFMLMIIGISWFCSFFFVLRERLNIGIPLNKHWDDTCTWAHRTHSNTLYKRMRKEKTKQNDSQDKTNDKTKSMYTHIYIFIWWV